MSKHKWMPASVLTILLAMQATGSNAEPRIGTAASTRPTVEAISGANTQTLSTGSEIYENQTVRTGNRGMADLVFVDKTNLNVGPRSEVRLDKFVYDPNGSAGSVVMQATQGRFRFVTGSQAHEAYRVSTPHGTLGVHGTTVEFLVNKPGEECVTKLRLVEGKAEYKVAKTGQVARLDDPNKNNVACISASGQVSYSTSSESIVAGLGEASTPPPPGVPGTGIGTGTTPITPPPCMSQASPNCGG
jgi:ferric-dicitrate binding protein FerR (iron transport regulator)